MNIVKSSFSITSICINVVMYQNYTLYLHSEDEKFIITLDAVTVVFSEHREQCFHTFFHNFSFPRGLLFSQKERNKVMKKESGTGEDCTF